MAAARSSSVLSPVVPLALPSETANPGRIVCSPSGPIRMWRFPRLAANHSGQPPAFAGQKHQGVFPDGEHRRVRDRETRVTDRPAGYAESDQAPSTALEPPVRPQRDGGEDLTPVGGPRGPHAYAGSQGINSQPKPVHTAIGSPAQAPSSDRKRTPASAPPEVPAGHANSMVCRIAPAVLSVVQARMAA